MHPLKKEIWPRWALLSLEQALSKLALDSVKPGTDLLYKRSLSLGWALRSMISLLRPEIVPSGLISTPSVLRWAASCLKICPTFSFLSLVNLGPHKNDGKDKRVLDISGVGVGGGWAPETSSAPHCTNPRATCLDVPDLMSLHFKIVYEKQNATIMASLSLRTGHVTTLFLPPKW